MEVEKVNILGITYKVEQVEQVSRYDQLFGQIDFMDQTIRIDNHASEEKKQETLLHEILHGIAEATGLGEVLKESVVQTLSRSLYDILINQNVIFSWTAAEKERSQPQS